MGNRVEGLLNQRLRAFGGSRGLAGQAAHFLGHYGKSLALCTHPGCLHRGVERQNISLGCDFINRLDDLSDLRGTGIDFSHRGLHLLHLLITGENIGTHFTCRRFYCQ